MSKGTKDAMKFAFIIAAFAMLLTLMLAFSTNNQETFTNQSTLQDNVSD